MTGNTEISADQSPALPPVTQIHWRVAGSWILYDLANTIYAAVITYVLAPYFTNAFQTKTPLGITQTLSMIASGLMVPVMASLCDRTGQTRLFLSTFTLICIASMFGWAVWPTMWGLLVLLFIGNLCYQNATTFYNALLPSVAPPDRTGLVSGLGVGLGYIGTIVTIAVALLLVKVGGFGFQLTVAVCAGLFLVLAAPCLLFVRERRQTPSEPFTGALVRQQFSGVVQTLQTIRRDRVLLAFFVGNFCLVDVLNTAILYFATFTQDVFGVLADARELDFFGLALDAQTFALVMGLWLCSLALIAGVIVGWIGDRLHPLQALRLSAWCLLLALAGGIAAGGRSPLLYLLTMGLGGAFGLAGIWTAGRQTLLALSPPAQVGEYMGLYGITNKLSVIGSTTFAVVADWSRADLTRSLNVPDNVALVLSSKEALSVQLVPIVVGLVLLYTIRLGEVPRTAALGD